MRFNFRINDLELKSCNQRLLQDGEHLTAEIIQWSKNEDREAYCWVVAHWDSTEDGYNLKLVGSRPFRTDKDSFWRLAEQGQVILEGRVDG